MHELRGDAGEELHATGSALTLSLTISISVRENRLTFIFFLVVWYVLENHSHIVVELAKVQSMPPSVVLLCAVPKGLLALP